MRLGIFFCTLAFLVISFVHAEESSPGQFETFTGKISRNNVRLRLHPSIDSPIIHELDLDDMVVVVDAIEDFYVIRPPSFLKAYVYKNFVIEDQIQGDRVNVRLDPHLESPIIAQLNHGDKIQGKISPLNSKWMEITPPATARFYIAKELIEKAGDEAYLAHLENKRHDTEAFLSQAEILSTQELDKPFPSISLDALLQNLVAISEDQEIYQNQAERAKTLCTSIQEKFLEKNIAYLEEKSNQSEKQIAYLENQQNDDKNTYFHVASQEMATWVPVEMAIYKTWAQKEEGRTLEEFYEEQGDEAITLKGVIQAYDRPIKNKPGDYLLVNRATGLPIAYLYSTKVSLREKIGEEVEIKAVLRPNHDFAYPAYFVLSFE